MIVPIKTVTRLIDPPNRIFNELFCVPPSLLFSIPEPYNRFVTKHPRKEGSCKELIKASSVTPTMTKLIMRIVCVTAKINPPNKLAEAKTPNLSIKTALG